MCNECGNRSHWHDTLWMFRGYGFVEMYPRRLVLENEEVRLKFTIDKNETTGQLVVDFAVPVGESVVKFFNDEMERLIQFRNKHYGEDTVSLSSSSSSALSSTTFLGKKPDAMPLLEWQNIGELWAALYEAYVTANEAASTMDLSEEVWEMGEEWYAPESEEEDDDDDNYDDDNYEYENENAYSYGHDTFEHHDHADDYDYDTQSDNMSHEYDGGESTDDEVLAEDSNHEKHPWNQRHHSASQHDEL
uniref:Uncharacterized protein n=1 Tax=Craspedostauros australis TaxID=1486917 RepID=A0A7R9WRW6_9STRA